jgi:hypothetical protein
MVVYASLGSIVASGLLSNCETIECKDHLVLWKDVQNKSVVKVHTYMFFIMSLPRLMVMG